ncbi:unnamed protein product [Fraxinus pennsylvanica]|uniref:Uncharacterized protein n=1 Tax=Fraxinus pennsylvanica TaxID=56036 RepID=A0AAD1ZJK8_9LAMI|nr:unnamed protein product [Fraxinus pennsylvanica]
MINMLMTYEKISLQSVKAFEWLSLNDFSSSDRAYISETVFNFVFLSFVLWTFHPFIFKSKKIYTVLIWCRVLACLVACQFLRIITFYSTQLPGPNIYSIYFL